MAMSSSVLSDQMEGLNINKNMKEVLKVGAAQITPIFLNKAATIKKVKQMRKNTGK